MLTVTVLIGFIFLIQPCGIISENTSYLRAFLYRIRTAIFCDAFYNDKWVGNLFYVQQNLSVNMRCDHNARLFYFCNNYSYASINSYRYSKQWKWSQYCGHKLANF